MDKRSSFNCDHPHEDKLNHLVFENDLVRVLFVAAASTKCYAAENMRFNSATGSSFSQTLLQANTLVEFRKLQIAFFNVVSST
jgi:hypothetical protein